MGLLSKVMSRDKDVERRETDEPSSKLPREEALEEALDPGAPPTPGPGVGEDADEAGVLAQYAELTESNVEEAGDEKEPDADGDMDLMNIFTSDEEEDVALSAMTQSLEDIDMHALLAEVIDLAAELREHVESQ